MVRTSPIHLGISTCPNDTFAMAALMDRSVDWQGLEFCFELMDIQQLNDRLLTGDLDVGKTSFHAALKLADAMVVLPSGSALGFGVGPLLLAARSDDRPGPDSLTLCPGGDTTATLLMRLYYGDVLGTHAQRLRQVVFSEIMPALQRGEADFGVCIHEGRFTWQQAGLHLVEDLGLRWERDTAMPLPLGGLVARRSLGDDVIAKVQDCVRQSLLHARQNPAATLPTMRRYAQEFSDDVLMRHVDLYVNDWTIDLGPLGREALAMLDRRAKAAGVVPADQRPLTVFCRR